MSHRRRRRRIALLLIALAGLFALVFMCLRPGLNSYSWWLARAVEESHFIENVPARGNLLKLVVDVQAGAGDFFEAKETVKTIREPKLSLLTRIRRAAAGLLARLGIGSQPLNMPVFNPNFPFSSLSHVEAQAYAGVAAAQARAGDIAGARDTAEMIDTRSGAYAAALVEIIARQGMAGNLDAAEAAARAIPDTGPSSSHLVMAKLQAFQAIMVARAKAGDVPGVRAAADAAAELVPFYGRALGDQLSESIARALAEAGKIDAAAEIAEKITDPRKKAAAYYAIVVAQADSGDLDGANTTAQGINVDWFRLRARAHIAGAHAGAGNAAEAGAAAEAIADAYFRAYAYQRMCEAQAHKGDVDAARATARRIDDAVCRSEAYCAIATAQLNAGDLEGARAAADLIAGGKKLAVYLSLAEAHAAAGDADGCARYIQQAREAAGSPAASVPPEVRGAIADAQARTGDLAGAVATMNAATKGFELPGKEPTLLPGKGAAAAKLRLAMLRRIARAYASGPGRLSEALKLVKSLKTPEERGHWCLGAAEGLIRKRADRK